MLRPATLQDVGALVEIAMSQTASYPLRPDREKIKALAREGVSSSKDFLWVDEDSSGNIQAVLAAFSGENIWAQRRFASVMLWWSARPGRGAALLKRFVEWVRSRRAIKVAGFAIDQDLDRRTLRLMERLGFKRHGGSYLLYN